MQVISTIIIICHFIRKCVRVFKLQEENVDEDDPWKVILSAVSFSIHYKYHTPRGKILCKIVFGCNKIIRIDQIINYKVIENVRRLWQIKNYAKDTT